MCFLSRCDLHLCGNQNMNFHSYHFRGWLPFIQACKRIMVETQDSRRTQFVRMTGLKLALKIQTITTNQGLNVDTVNWADRATEAWAYGKELTLDCRGKPVKQLKSLVSLLKYWIQ